MKRFALIIMMALTLCAYAREIQVSVETGEHWKEKKNPQLAIWLEDEDGTFLETLYITTKAEKKNWAFAPKDGRPESLPVYYHASRDKVDLVSSATPKGSFALDGFLDDQKGYVIKAEFNNSYDYNDTYTKKNSGVNGQPSVVYGAEIPLGFSGSLSLEFIGCGSPDGRDGEIHMAQGLTTAMEIVGDISIVIL